MSNQVFNCIATAAFGLEGLVAEELRRLGCQQVKAEPGGARFCADAGQIALANLSLRCADRVQILLAEAPCRSFEELFQLVRQIPWEQIVPLDGKYNVSGKCVRSQLMSVRDCQAITKKAIIERLRQAAHRQTFPENGAAMTIDLHLHKDLARITLDTSGAAFNRRGYRTWNGEAPIRETLAAALVELSGWRPEQPLYDPCCGTGTLLIEAAWSAIHRAPGLTRSFAFEAFPAFREVDLAALRQRSREFIDWDRLGSVAGSDLDPEALKLAERHLQQAGLAGRIPLRQILLQQLQLEDQNGVFLCNPPYGERMSDRQKCQRLYRELHQLQLRHPGWTLCAISSDPAFERAYGRRANRKRRLYNGRLECEFLVFQP